jgi:tetratricopeptide (TPR) repeat protein
MVVSRVWIALLVIALFGNACTSISGYHQFQTGKDYYFRMDYTEAAAHFSRAITLNPSDFRVKWYLGWTLFYSREYEKSKDFFLQALALPDGIHSQDRADWETADILNGLADAEFYLVEYQSAIEYALQSLSIKNDNPGLWLILGWAYYYLADYDRAADSFGNSIALDSSIAEAYAGLSRCRFMNSRFKEALVLVDKALKQNPAESTWWVLKGSCHFELGQRNTALNCIRKALSLDPANAEARFMESKFVNE